MSALPDMAIFCGGVCHRRRQPARRAFRQPLLMLFVNSERQAALAGKLGWLGKLGILSWRRQDYLPAPGLSLRDAALAALQARTGVRAAGPVYVLAQPRQFGCGYNPAAFYFICDGESRPAHLLVEVHNTPWGERFCYAGAYPPQGAMGASRMRKRHRVSPFNPLEMTYEWRYCQPRDRFFIRMRCLQGERVHFEATLLLRRTPFSRRHLLGAAVRHPFSAAAGAAAIYWHALRLWLKKTPLHREQFSAAADARQAPPLS